MFTQFKRLTWKASLLAALVSLLGVTVALAASGDLDTTFSGDGRVVTDFGGQTDVAYDIAIQSDGKIVAAGYSFATSISNSDFAVTRYNPGGGLDTTFGQRLTDFGGLDQAFAVAVQSNGKIIVAGRTCNEHGIDCNLALARYNSNGILDSTFSGDGKQTTEFGGDDNGSGGGLIVQSNGKIVVAGYMYNGSNYDAAVYRYRSNGSLDTTFSGDGMVEFGFGTGYDSADDLRIQSDGKIVVVGTTADANSANFNFAIARLNPNGTLDATFSGDGKQTTNFGATEGATALALQSDGKIVVAGNKYREGFFSFALARYHSNGSLDTTFNGTGRKVFSIEAGALSSARDVFVRPNGRIVVAGGTDVGSNIYDFALVRLNPAGAFDTSFSGDGKVTIDFGGNDDANALALQSNGKYVLAGFTQGDFALARVLP